MRILANIIQCAHCGDVIESENRYDYKRCRCGAVAVDGGHDYLRRCCDTLDDYIELSKVVDEAEDRHD